MISEIHVKSILNKKKKRDDWFLDEYTVNAYEGCSMNCIYCYVRGSKYGENMAERLSVKINAPEVLEKQLQFRVKKNQYGIVVLSSATDVYMPIDSKYGMTQKFLLLFLKYKFPVHIITKSDRILNDAEILKQLDADAILPDDLKNTLKRGLIISFSISSLDKSVTDHLEPGAIAPIKRLETMQQLKEKGFLVGVNCLPVLPFISDSSAQIEEMISTSKKYGADYVLVGGLTLFGNEPASSKVLFYKFLEKYHPHLVTQYKSLYRIYPYPPKAYHDNINTIVKKLCEKYEIRNSII
ncbi:MAG: radical SAM protein [Fimbriimonadaceae bacterium]|nr:radical SAM protein [Chitinophagales bacterium]